MENQLLKALQNNKLFSNVDVSKIDLGKVRGKLVTLQEGQILYREGDSADIIYLVITGEINVLKKKLLGKSKSDIYGENEFFGHDEYFEETSRTSTAVALRDTYIIALGRDEIDYLIQCDDEIIVNLREPKLAIDEDVLNELKTGDETVLPETAAAEFPVDSTPESENTPPAVPSENFESVENENRQPEKSGEDLDDALFKIFSDRDSTPVFAPEDTPLLSEDKNADFSVFSEKEEQETPPNFSDDFNEIPGVIPDENEFKLDDNKFIPEDNTASEDEAFFAGLSFDEKILNTDEFSRPEDPGIPENDSAAGENETAPTEADDITQQADELEGNAAAPEEHGVNYDEIFADDDILKEAETKLEELKKDKSPQNFSTSKSSPEEGGQMTTDQLHMIIKAAELVNSTIRIDEALKSIVDVASNLTTADRGTLYLVDREKHELWSMVAMGNETREIRLKIGEGLAGYVAKTGEVINIADVQKDNRFNPEVDKATGYKTKNMICFPIKNKESVIIGVLQLLNSARGEFTKSDEEFLNAISIHSAIALQNAEMVEKLLQSERVHSLGKMANFLIQDIKKPILVSKRYSEHLKTKELSVDVAQVVDMLLEQLTQVADLVQTTSSYSEGKTMLRMISASVNSTLNDFNSRIGAYVESRNCRIIHEFDKDATLKLDVKEFYQCYNHLIKNACDAMPDGGAITITTKREDKKIKIIFRDKGMGFPEGFKEKIFEPFMSLGKKEGTGLGLAITRKIIEAHNGTIEAESILGEGATFTVTLPVASVI